MRVLELQLPLEPESVPAARGSLDALQSRIPHSALEDARLMVSELVTNSLRHAGAANHSIELVADIEGQTLMVQVRDQGKGFRPHPRAPDAPPDSGWGLYLVEQLADRWGATSDGATCVWFELALESESA
jgi:anti-sigma regulatory factor (Ser/Thr protein kinase)